MIIYLNKYGEELAQREFIELQWTRRCYEAGNFTLLMRAEDWDNDIKYVQVDGRRETGIVQKIQYENKPDGEYITASGFFIEKLLDWGMFFSDAHMQNDLMHILKIICYSCYSQFTNDLGMYDVQDIAKAVTNNLYCAYVKPFSGSARQLDVKIPAGDPAGKAMYKLLRTEGFTINAVPKFNDGARENTEPLIGLELNIVKLEDKSDKVYFNKNIGSVKNIEYMFDDSGVATKMLGVQVIDEKLNYTGRNYVYKDGKYQPAIIESYQYDVNSPRDVGKSAPLKVIYTSASNVEEGEEAQVRAQMQSALKLELLNNYKVEHISCDVLQDIYMYPRDYDLGDLCTVQLDELEIEYSARIVEIREVYHKNMSEVEILLGTPTRKEYRKVL